MLFIWLTVSGKLIFHNHYRGKVLTWRFSTLEHVNLYSLSVFASWELNIKGGHFDLLTSTTHLFFYLYEFEMQLHIIILPLHFLPHPKQTDHLNEEDLSQTSH